MPAMELGKHARHADARNIPDLDSDESNHCGIHMHEAITTFGLYMQTTRSEEVVSAVTRVPNRFLCSSYHQTRLQIQIASLSDDGLHM